MTSGEDLFARHRPMTAGAAGDDGTPRDTPPGDRVERPRDQQVDHTEHVHEVVHVQEELGDGEAVLSEPSDPTEQAGAELGPGPVGPESDPVESEHDEAPVDPDATTRIEPVPTSVSPGRVVSPLAGPPPSSPGPGTTRLESRRNGHGGQRPTEETWDTGTIRRWDAAAVDEEPTPSTAPLRRPAQLDDREEVTVERESGGSRWYEIPVMIITALTLAFLLRTFVVQVFYIPSGSMIPTLEVNDRIAVEKISYLTREPARGEVIVFAGDDPLSGLGEESTADRVLTGVGQFLGVVPVDAKDFVKRVIGLPGDEVSITDGRVSVNGVELDEPYARLDNDSGDWVVPEGMLFVMGDNRANSGDSRSTLGYIPEDDVVGRAVLVIWPFDRAGSIPGEAHDLAVDAGS